MIQPSGVSRARWNTSILEKLNGMRSLRSAQETRRQDRAFTVVEVLVTSALVGVVALAAYSILYSGLTLSRQNAGLNLSSLRMRQMIDRIGEQTRYSMQQPELIKTDGTPASGTAAEGLLLKRFLGTPYILKESGGSTGNIAETAKQFRLEFRKGLPAPSAGDFIIIDSPTAPDLEISAATKVEETSSLQKWQITTTTAVGEQLRPSVHRVAAHLYRKEAFVFVATETVANPRSELRHYSRVRTATNFSQKSNYRVLASGFRKAAGKNYFTNSTANALTSTTLTAIVHSTGREEYLDQALKTKNYTTVPIEVRLWAMRQ